MDNETYEGELSKCCDAPIDNEGFCIKCLLECVTPESLECIKEFK